jgi:hypothetical protein
VKDELVSDNRPCLRLLVQCPAKLPENAKPGWVAPDGTGPDDQFAKKEKRDFLVIISDENLHVFDEKTSFVIRLFKKQKLN